MERRRRFGTEDKRPMSKHPFLFLFLLISAIHYSGIEGSTHASSHANMFPLVFGIVPDQYQQSVISFIKSRGMVCSVYGAQYLLEGLYQYGEADYALQLMTSTGDRS